MEDTRRCEQYECNKPYFYTLPEFGHLCKQCYLGKYNNDDIKTIYMLGDY